MHKKIHVLAILPFALYMYNILAVRTIHNKTDITLYAAGYHTGDNDQSNRLTDIVTIAPHTNGDIDVPKTKIFSSKKRYVVISREERALMPQLLTNVVKVLPHINITAATSKLEGDYYVVDRDGRLALYNSIEYSKVG